MPQEKPIHWLGSSLKDLQSFPEDTKKEAGYQLHRIQNGLQASDWKSLPMVGKGAEEVRLENSDGAYRIIYIARAREAIYVLHCFQKKSQRTAKADINAARLRFRLISKVRYEV